MDRYRVSPTENHTTLGYMIYNVDLSFSFNSASQFPRCDQHELIDRLYLFHGIDLPDS